MSRSMFCIVCMCCGIPVGHKWRGWEVGHAGCLPGAAHACMYERVVLTCSMPACIMHAGGLQVELACIQGAHHVVGNDTGSAPPLFSHHSMQAAHLVGTSGSSCT